MFLSQVNMRHLRLMLLSFFEVFFVCSRFRIVLSIEVEAEIVEIRFHKYSRKKTAAARASAYISPALRALMHANARCFVPVRKYHLLRSFNF